MHGLAALLIWLGGALILHEMGARAGGQIGWWLIVLVGSAGIYRNAHKNSARRERE